MSAEVVAEAERLRIGDVARLVGTTARTIRYYEEIGLLPGAEPRDPGRHRLYSEADVQRLREVLRLKELLGVSLDELRELVEAQDARAALRDEFDRSDDPVRRREILIEAAGYIDRQLELVRRRKRELQRLEDELTGKRRLVRRRLRDLGEDA
ncbi:MAG TPA: MerR family transcriptional regulator [Solirubrobacteraceae bacterium]|nr:MerR family transcriptional regulator [Solirubrobacteraceae bacterium]